MGGIEELALRALRGFGTLAALQFDATDITATDYLNGND